MSSLTPNAIATYLKTIADWRESRYNDDLRDKRNLVAADGLRELAAYVVDQPDDDARIEELGRLCMRGETFEPGQQLHYEVGRFRFFSPESTVDGFLTLMVDLARADSTEHGRFGGPQIEGDDPWSSSDE